jgi:hypothetical protein
VTPLRAKEIIPLSANTQTSGFSKKSEGESRQ